ncbi:MAG: PilZ domain-containing protein [Phycisphaerae bacterium]
MKHRQYGRREIDLSVRVVVAPESAAQVALASGGALEARMTDISGGGARVLVSTFLPRATCVELNIPDNAWVPAGAVRARVVASTMTHRAPSYALGLRFEDPANPVVVQLRESESTSGPGE